MDSNTNSTKKTWPVSYNRMKRFWVFLIPFLAMMVAPYFFSSNSDFFKKYEYIFDKGLLVAVIIIIIGFIIMIIKNLKGNPGILSLTGTTLSFRNKSINLKNADISFGKYGWTGLGPMGLVLCIRENNIFIKIGVLQYYLDDPNAYTENLAMTTDCFIDKKQFLTLLQAIETDRKVEVIRENAFSDNDFVLGVQYNINIWKYILLFWGFMSIPTIINIIFNLNNNKYITASLFFLAFGCFIYYLIKNSNKAKGFYIVINKGIVSFLDLQSKNKIFTTSIQDIETDVYILKLGGKTSVYFLTIRLKIPGFRKFTIGQPANLGVSKWKDTGLKVKWWTLSPPNFIVNEATWEKLAHILGVHV